jgi:hypothetical protein
MALKLGELTSDEDGGVEKEISEDVLGKPRVSEGWIVSDMAEVEEEPLVSPDRVDMWLSNVRAARLPHLCPETRGGHA